jgi:FKBP-type peptidyl-prolyl cis-trans isomerase 2
MKKAQSGDKVKFHITGTLEEGIVFADSRKGKPLEIEIGQSKVLHEIQQAIIGMEQNEQKTTRLSAEQGYGPYREELVKEVNKEFLPKDMTYEKGKTVNLTFTSGKDGNATILDVSDSTVILDLNHPLAGKNLIFEISLLEIH